MDTFSLRHYYLSTGISFSLAIIFLLIACTGKQESTRPRKVYIKEESGRYRLYNNGKLFTIKGASGYSNLRTLKEAGGNTIRVWDTTNLATILDSAKANHLMVVAGLPIFNKTDDNTFYETPAKVNRQYKLFKAIVNKFKDDPAILMWCVGNELPFPSGVSYHKFYKAFNNLTDMIRQEDPDHPITTTLSKFNSKYLFNIVTRCDIDIISFNIFGSIKSLREELRQAAWFWTGPYLLTEWGIDGAWPGTGVKQTAWGAFVEPSSQKKAEFYYNYYAKSMPVEDSRFMGSFVFFWGSKQETTHTWFSLFDDHGNKTETVNAIQSLWKSEPLVHNGPEINYVTIEHNGALDNVILSAADTAMAEVHIYKNSNAIKSIKWEIYNEDWYLINKKTNSKKLAPIATITTKEHDYKLTYITPSTEGPYRLFATVYDGFGNISTCNIPFYVMSEE
jgi:hypothetical protein